jgi:hypothetical protein
VGKTVRVTRPSRSLGDAVDGALQFPESPVTRGEFDHHENRPGVADSAHHISDAAVRVIGSAARLDFGGYFGVRE